MARDSNDEEVTKRTRTGEGLPSAKSSYEFIAWRTTMKTTSSRMPPPAALLSSQNQKPGYSEMGDGEERTNIRPDHHPELRAG